MESLSWFCLRFKLYFYCYLCVYVFITICGCHMCVPAASARRGQQISSELLLVAMSCLMLALGTKLRALEEQQALLSDKPPPQPQQFCYVLFLMYSKKCFNRDLTLVCRAPLRIPKKNP